jgi:flagellar hook-associated protein 2
MSSTSSLSSLLSSISPSSAIDISDILEAATGASSAGIDVSAAVSSAVTAAEAPEDAWQSQITALQSQTTALTQIQTDATNLDNDVQALNNLTGPLSATTVTSSNSSVVTATAASGSAMGNTVVQVTNLASTASYISTAESSTSFALPAENITITNGSGAFSTITTGSGVNTLSDLETAVNNAGLGVTASIISDASGSRLVITSNTSGSAGNFTVTSTGTSFDFATAVTGKNASLQVNGITVTSSSNTVTGAVPGLTLNLLSASPGTAVSLSVAPNTSQASAAINQFVNDYNQAIGDLNAQYADSGTGQGALSDDPTVRNLQSELLAALDYTATSPSGGATATTVPTLASLGISVNADGTLSVDSTTLNNVLQTNFGDVQNFFQGTAMNGFANSLDQQLTSFISPADGAFTVDLQSISTQTSGLQTDISNFQTNVITPLQTQLQSEFSQAEILLQQLPNEMKQIDEELGQNSSSGS